MLTDSEGYIMGSNVERGPNQELKQNNRAVQLLFNLSGHPRTQAVMFSRSFIMSLEVRAIDRLAE